MKENKLEDKVNQLESHIEKLHDMLNLEDRITASDVLCRLTVLEAEVNRHKVQLMKNVIPVKVMA